MPTQHCSSISRFTATGIFVLPQIDYNQRTLARLFSVSGQAFLPTVEWLCAVSLAYTDLFQVSTFGRTLALPVDAQEKSPYLHNRIISSKGLFAEKSAFSSSLRSCTRSPEDLYSRSVALLFRRRIFTFSAAFCVSSDRFGSSFLNADIDASSLRFISGGRLTHVDAVRGDRA